MVQPVRKKNILAMFLLVVFVFLTVSSEGLAHRRPYRHHHSKKKGAVIGGAAGAGTGYLVQRHRNKRRTRHY